MIMENNLYNVTEEGSLLVSYPPKNLNGSSYRCIASNSFGTVMSRAATLEIAYVDTFPVPSAPRYKTLNAKLGTCITCNPPEAYPGIHADWKAGVFTDINSNDRIREMIDGRLCFAYTTTGDRGTYYCVVSNKYDKGEATKRSPPLSFDVINVLDLHQLLNGPDGTLIYPNSTQLKYNQELRIPNAQPQDSGEYQCIGASRGYSETVSRYLTVLAPPNLVSGLKDAKVDSGSTVTMQCTADDDGVEFSWYHNTRLLNSSMKRPRISEDNTLTIDNVMVQDSGIYQCAARNEHGMSLSTAQLSVEEQEPTEMKPTESEIDQPDSRSPGNTVGDTFVYIFAAMVSAALLEIL
ncbi:Contactin-4 [Holothuria leucospilota]|uniref:Contactin-4 n=1 Tax=Holothuria leucospilota TaxID=206669 RepID=A0A9Q1HJQ5_HOLLE|nr:Contactin-4 [Holothuria leucospilota]